MTKLVEIYLLGLMVLAPNPDAGRMQVLLVKSDDPYHLPFLAFDARRGQCVSTGTVECREIASDFCFCRLFEDFELSFDPATDREAGSILPRPDAVLPSGIATGQRPEWLVRMANIDEVASRKLKDWRYIEHLVSVRTSFGWSRAQNCRLEESERGRVHRFEFVNGQHQRASRHEQALSEAFVFDSHVTLPQGGSTYELVLTSRTAKKDPVHIELDCRNGCSPLLIGNAPLVSEDAPEEEYGHHFVYYAALFDGAKGLIPHRLATGLGTVSAGAVQPLRCKIVERFLELRKPLDAVVNPQLQTTKSVPSASQNVRRNINGPVICPMVLADPAPE